MPGQVQGISPVMGALPTARTLNKAKQIRLESASIRVAGIYTMLNDSTFNPRTVRMKSGTFLQVGSNSTENPTIRPLPLAGDPQFGELVLEDEKADLREIMHDYPQPNPQPGMTAYEFAERDAEAKQNRGQAYERASDEIGRPFLRATTYILSEVGILDDLVEAVGTLQDGRPRPLLFDGTDVRVEFASPLAEAQRARKANKTFQWISQLQQTVGPEATNAGVRTEAVPTSTGQDLNIDLTLVRPAQEAADIMTQRAQQQQEMQAPTTARSI